jgi:hypothetical protein
MASPTKFFTIVLLACATLSANAFVTPSKCISSVPSVTTAQQPSTTALSERQWNFNEGQGPWGMKKNAETWNGRVAQVNTNNCSVELKHAYSLWSDHIYD